MNASERASESRRPRERVEKGVQIKKKAEADHLPNAKMMKQKKKRNLRESDTQAVRYRICRLRRISFAALCIIVSL